MDQFQSAWKALDLRKRIIVIGATLTMFAAVLGLSRMATAPSMALLYAGLEPGAAGEVVKALEAQGAAHEVRSGAIYVEAAMRDQLRMTLATEGLPSDSGKGYELLDGLSGFGTTSQMFDAAYWRAKEGELARTIVSSPLIQSARVHIGAPSGSGFRQRAAPTGSVTVTTREGSLSSAQAKALRFLVASAVPGLNAADVSVIDTRGGLIAVGDDAPSSGADGTDRAQEMRENVERILEARVGYGNAVVEVSVETAKESETIVERKVDPESRVAIATETAETAATASESGAGGVTVASNLPDGDGADGDEKSASNNTETRERINYEISETTREIQRGPGTVKRITVAVLVNGIETTDASGATTWAPREQAEMEALRELVASAVGFNEARGDSLTIKSMQFSPLPEAGSEASSTMLSNIYFDAMSLIRLLVLAAVAIILGLFVIRPALTKSSKTETPKIAKSTQKTPETLPVLSGELDDGSFPDLGEITNVSDLELNSETNKVQSTDSVPKDPVDRLRAMIDEKGDEMMEILHGWMEEA